MILWLVFIIVIRATSLNLLKIIAAMMSAYNLAWFVCFFCLFLVSEFPDKQTILFDIVSWLAFLGNSLFGLSHWILVMNYFTLAVKLHYPKKEFDRKLPRLNLIYFGVGALNVLLPISRQVCVLTNKYTISGYFVIALTLTWVLTAAVLFWALVILKRFSGQHIIQLNVKEMSVHCLAFLLFAADCVLVGFTES
jgi:hypothetical protein